MENNSLCKDQVFILDDIQNDFLILKVKEEIAIATLQDYLKN
jgi:hypothetical protein